MQIHRSPSQSRPSSRSSTAARRTDGTASSATARRSTPTRPPSPVRRSDRALAPVAGVLLLAITVVLAGGVVGVAIDSPPDPAPTASLSLSVSDDRVTVTHRGGDALDASELDVRVRVDGEPLARQPPVPFFSAAGFEPGPTGAFNAASDDDWRAGGSASFRVAGTNDPGIEPGRTVVVEVSVEGRQVATLESTADAG
ncbi:type IV pilin N-terminal domain-containing protein [Halorubrum sp. AD140]|uniref:type IV pilin N-terminal domain-containing protein n=1 Tax=Halorubrum sp. AD140 TaxID=3050073 RepID=UPI002ACCC8A0|nr:type IV pilin N-terminal domain-containing protein [Halorubrum sp. AD140]MDZ5812252.1 type IV pilin N-terminal domain-containing protein [Halorubrum sp. AD140]